jgi:hypothetical protein
MLMRMEKTAAPRVLILFSFHFPKYTAARRTKVRNRQIPALAILKMTYNQHKVFQNPSGITYLKLAFLFPIAASSIPLGYDEFAMTPVTVAAI